MVGMLDGDARGCGLAGASLPWEPRRDLPGLAGANAAGAQPKGKAWLGLSQAGRAQLPEAERSGFAFQMVLEHLLGGFVP